MAIKKIQLRGISRTPSDRMTADGGCAESLNVYLDNDELAPIIVPEDISSLLGFPETAQADKIFIHKTANYENYIVVNENNGSSVKFIHDEKLEPIVYLEPGEKIIDISSIGNTLIISTDKQTRYSLYKNNRYLTFDGGFPKIRFDFVNIDILSTGNDSTLNTAHNRASFQLTKWPDVVLGTEENAYRVESESGIQLLTQINEEYQNLLDKNAAMGAFSAPFFLMYGIRLYDGSIVNLSAPIMLGSAFFYKDEKKDLPLNIRVLKEVNAENDRAFDYTVSVNLCNPFKIGVYKYIDNIDLSLWKDIIASVDVFISPTVNLFPDRMQRAKWGDNEVSAGVTYKTIVLDPINSENKQNIEQAILGASTFNLIKSYTLQEIKNAAGGDVEVITSDLTQEKIALNESLYSQSINYGNVSLGNMSTYNSRVISSQGYQLLSRGLPTLNGQHAHSGAAEYSYAFKYYVNTASTGELISISEDIESGNQYISPKNGRYLNQQGQTSSVIDGICEPFTWLSFPDSRCEYIEILKKNTDGTGWIEHSRIKMSPHPFLPNVSYAFIGLGTALADIQYGDLDTGGYPDDMKEFDRNTESRREDLLNKVLVSDVNNPFVYPASGRVTFDSKVLSFAIATTPLSQGQFGQFPLYVFTEDGVWAMETAADGSFVSSKPLSRDVCVNPDSITAIDNAVVFVTEKGVMLLRGSKVVNISPYMNGRHYAIDSTAMSIINAQEGFCKYQDTLSDKTPFMAFAKKASVAYDYAGQRLIFICEDEKYQYIYKLDTQTWHKTAHEANLVRAINSYPDCQIQGHVDYFKKTIRVTYNHTLESDEPYLIELIQQYLPDVSDNMAEHFLRQADEIDVTKYDDETIDLLAEALSDESVLIESGEGIIKATKIYNLSTILDPSEHQYTEKGIIATRPFDLGEPDVLKTITDVRIRGQFARGAVKFILLGSIDGINFRVISTLRGKSWKLFRIIVLADLDATERISWIDVQYETRLTNKLR